MTINMPLKNRICLWYDSEALDAAKYYAQTFPNSSDHLAKSTPSTIFSISCPIGICVGFDSSELTVTLAVPGHSHLRLEQLRLSFKTKLLRDICERDRTAVDAFGAEHAALLQDALAELRASSAIADMPRWRERLTTVGSKQLEFEYAGTVVSILRQTTCAHRSTLVTG